MPSIGLTEINDSLPGRMYPARRSRASSWLVKTTIAPLETEDVHRLTTNKQFGDAGEYFVAGRLGLAGTPTVKLNDGQPGFDLIAMPTDGRPPQRISVKAVNVGGAGTWVTYKPRDQFEWLAVVAWTGPAELPRTFIIPRVVADQRQRQSRPDVKVDNGMFCNSPEVERIYPEYEDNFLLEIDPNDSRACPLKRQERKELDDQREPEAERNVDPSC